MGDDRRLVGASLASAWGWLTPFIVLYVLVGRQRMVATVALSAASSAS
jgi:hypothetical protein